MALASLRCADARVVRYSSSPRDAADVRQDNRGPGAQSAAAVGGLKQSESCPLDELSSDFVTALQCSDVLFTDDGYSTNSNCQ